MNNHQALNDFILDLQQTIKEKMEREKLLQVDAFTEYMIETLVEAGELEDGHACYHKTRGLEVSGYHLDDDGSLNLFLSLYSHNTSITSLGKGDIEAGFKRLNTFLQKSFDEPYYLTLEESSHVFDMSNSIYESRKVIERIRFFLFTDSQTNVSEMGGGEFYGLPVTYHIWDILRLYRYSSSGLAVDPIQIDFVRQFGRALPCLQGTDDESGDYTAYLTVIPGNILKDLYAMHGTRLLELNVRSYLQAKGKVNKGIQQTIQNQPERFLAYNNGISATASHIELESLPEGGLGIRALHDLQIVNGGQTTASIYYFAHKSKKDVSRLRVQAKISVVGEKGKQEMVSLISRYANSQNKVSDADFNANDPFHVQIETFSRSIWAPAAEGTQRQTRWFYERARGQYQDALAHEGTLASQKRFKESHPLAQKFTKTDVAKYEMTWQQCPHIVSAGAQKCFIHFSTALAKRGHFEVDKTYFYHLIAKAILFKRAETIVGNLNFGGYRANIVTYTLAYLCHQTAGRIDLERIWQRQDIGQGLVAAIELVARKIHAVIIAPPDGKNVTEWCKKEACWDSIQTLSIELSNLLSNELLMAGQGEGDKGFVGLDEEEQQLIHQVAAIPAETWYRLVAWSKETHNLLVWQRGIAESLGRLRMIGEKKPSIKQARQGIRMIEEASRLGFKLVLDENIAD